MKIFNAGKSIVSAAIGFNMKWLDDTYSHQRGYNVAGWNYVKPLSKTLDFQLTDAFLSNYIWFILNLWKRLVMYAYQFCSMGQH